MATNAEVKDLLEAGVHFGHLTRKWNPNMAPYIYMERNGMLAGAFASTLAVAVVGTAAADATYTFTVTDANGCTGSDTITITEPPQLTASAIASPVLCNGDTASVDVSASGGTPPYSGTGTFSRTAGTYTFIEFFFELDQLGEDSVLAVSSSRAYGLCSS